MILNLADLEVLQKQENHNVYFAGEGVTVPAHKNRRLSDWITRNTDCHPRAEILVGLSGKSLYGSCGKLVEISPGTAVIFPPYAAHQRGYPDFYPDVTHLWISIFQGKFFAYLRRIENGRMTGNPEDSFFVPEISIGCDISGFNQQIFNEKLFPAAVRLSLKGAVYFIFAAILDKIREPEESGKILSRHTAVTDKIRQYIAACSGHDVSLDKLSHIFGYSKYHLLRVFKKHVGMTIQNCIDEHRIKHTTNALATGKSKKIISAELGFSGPTAFSRWLRSKSL